MGYASKQYIFQILAQAFTTSSPREIGAKVDLLTIGNTFNSNLVPDATVDSYIQMSDSEIDSFLNQMYITPLSESADIEVRLFSPIDEYNDYIITETAMPFQIGDIIVLKDTVGEDRFTINSIVGDAAKNIFGVAEPFLRTYAVEDTRVIRVKYPDPIPLISARLSAANIYDKYFLSQSEPGKSDFGSQLRRLARVEINNILNGRTILHGVTRIGRRFYNPTLIDRYELPKTKGGADSNIDDLSA
jgi:hypothetical protein